MHSFPAWKLWKVHWYQRRRIGRRKFNELLLATYRHNHQLKSFRQEFADSGIAQIFLAAGQ